MDHPVDVLVAVPAHDEADSIGDCLTSVVASLGAAQRIGLVAAAMIALAVHRCRDDTEALARAAVAAATSPGPEVGLMIMVEEEPMRVGRLRTRLVEAAYRSRPVEHAWVLSTDADTLVPLHWVEELLAIAGREEAVLVLGLADLSGWDVDVDVAERYAELVEAGLTSTGHRHAYAANLAIRLDAFRQVGGFPALAHGEEHGLARAVRAAGLRIATPLQPRVLTSARMPGRAAHGLGALLDDLAHPPLREDLR